MTPGTGHGSCASPGTLTFFRSRTFPDSRTPSSRPATTQALAIPSPEAQLVLAHPLLEQAGHQRPWHLPAGGRRPRRYPCPWNPPGGPGSAGGTSGGPTGRRGPSPFPSRAGRGTQGAAPGSPGQEPQAQSIQTSPPAGGKIELRLPAWVGLQALPEGAASDAPFMGLLVWDPARRRRRPPTRFPRHGSLRCLAPGPRFSVSCDDGTDGSGGMNWNWDGPGRQPPVRLRGQGFPAGPGQGRWHPGPGVRLPFAPLPTGRSCPPGCLRPGGTGDAGDRLPGGPSRY